MSKQTETKFKWALHKVVIPTAVLSSSAALLIVSFQYHERQLAQQLRDAKPTVALAQQIGVQLQNESPPNTNNSASKARTSHVPASSSDSKTANTTAKKSTNPIKIVHAKSSSTKSHSTSHLANSTSAKTSSSQSTVAMNATSSLQKQVAPSGNVGAATPSIQTVLGGTVGKANPSMLADTTVESVVTQLGQNVLTSGVAGSLQSKSGGQLQIPSSMNVNRLVALSLKNGVLWAILPIDAGSATNGQQLTPMTTRLMYTPFPAHGKQSLSENAVTVGRIPSQVSGFTLGLGWTFPSSTSPAVVTETNSTTIPSNSTHSNSLSLSSPSSSTTASNTNASGTARPSNVTSNSVGATSPVSTNATNLTESRTSNTAIPSGSNSSSYTRGSRNPQESPTTTNAPAIGNQVYLSALTQTNLGAVVTIDIQSDTGVQTQAVYLFDEASIHISHLVDLPNDGTQFSWLAVGRNVIYYGTRTADLLHPGTFTLNQKMFDLMTDSATDINLNTYPEGTYPHGNQLVFQQPGTAQWQVFTPSLTGTIHRAKHS